MNVHLHCPHCKNPIELVAVPASGEITCTSCGSSFRLEQASTTGWDDFTGKRIGKFEVIGTLGKGAFGIVLKARDEELDRTVAIKIPRPGNIGESPQDLDRFLREARSAAQLRHPSIVTLHELGQHEGVPYLVSDFVEGVTLADMLTDRRPSFKESAELIAALADALHYAHAHGVVHRDVKPSNIMLELVSGRVVSGESSNSETPSSHSPLTTHHSPKLMDFGLAKRDAGEITMTIDGQVLGTPAYMSPEQARGEGHKVDGRSDVYSLGVILYQLLTGELPFRGNKNMLLYQVLHEDPRPPRRLNDKIPRDLETICLKCMQKEAGKRYATAQELADDLRRFLQGRPILARPVGRPEKTWRWAKRNPALAASGSLTVVALLALMLGSSWYFRQEAQRETAEALRQADAERIKALNEQEKQAKEMERRHRYLAETNSAYTAWEQGNLELVFDLLENQLPEPGQKDLRSFEWYHLWRLLAREPDLGSHQEMVRNVAFSPDGKWLASAGWDGKVGLWKIVANNFQEIPLPDYKGRATAVAFSPDSKSLASAAWPEQVIAAKGDRGQIRVRDLTTGKDRCFQAPYGLALTGGAGVTAMAFALDGKTLAMAVGGFAPDLKSEASRLLLIDLSVQESKERPGDFKEPEFIAKTNHLILSLAFSPDGKTLAAAPWKVAEHDSTGAVKHDADSFAVMRFDMNTRKEIFPRLKGHTQGVTCVAFSPDGKTLASCGWDATVRLWDAASGTPQDPLRGHTKRLWSVAFSRNGKMLASGGQDAMIKIWDMSTRMEMATLRGHAFSIFSLAFSPDGTLASASWDTTVKVWNPSELARLPSDNLENFSRTRATLDGHRNWVDCLAWSPDGKKFASGSIDGKVILWDKATGEGKPLAGHKIVASSLAFSPDSGTLASGGWDGKVILWDLDSGENRDILKQKHKVRSVVFTPDGKRLALGCEDGTIWLWDVAARRLLAPLRARDLVNCVAYSPDGKTMAAGTGDRYLNRKGKILLWDAKTCEELDSDTPLRSGAVTALAFSHDSKKLACWTAHLVSYDLIPGELHLWDLDRRPEQPSLVPTIKLQQHMGSVSSISFSPDGATVASGAGDHTVKLWDVKTGRARATLLGHTNRVMAAAFSPDGTLLVTAGLDHTVRLWRAAKDEDVVSYYRTRIKKSPDTSPDLARACWGLYRQRKVADSAAARKALLEGQEIIAHLRDQGRLKDDQKAWLGSFEKALLEMDSSGK